MNTDENGYFVEEEQVASNDRASIYLAKVMGWMCLGLFTTFVSTLLCLASDTVMNFLYSGRAVIYGVLIAQVVIVLALSFAINKLSPAAATVMFMVYAALMGLTMTTIAMMFTLNSIIIVFATTAVVFLGLSVYGFATKRDLTKIGTLAIFGLLGIIIGGIVNMFLRNSMLDFIITCVGVVVFVVLIAYDTQKIKNLYITNANAGYSDDDPQIRKLAIIGALMLYLDFINLFLKLMRLLGKRK